LFIKRGLEVGYLYVRRVLFGEEDTEDFRLFGMCDKNQIAIKKRNKIGLYRNLFYFEIL